MQSWFSYISLITIVAFFIPFCMFGQNELDPVDSLEQQLVFIDQAEEIEFINEGGVEYRLLKGDVILHQDTVVLFCDTAIVVNKLHVTAYGNVIIKQGDSLSVFADSLIYDGEKKIANLSGNVFLDSEEEQLRTSKLTYDLNEKLATYTDGASMYNERSQLSSKKGYYFVAEDRVYFEDSVRVVDSTFFLKADSLQFNTKTLRATFLGPTIITQSDSKLYCESGFYMIREEEATFSTNAQFIKEDKRASAQSIRYVGAKNQYILDGEAFFEDGEKSGRAERMIYDEAGKETILTGEANFRDGVKEIKGQSISYNENTGKYGVRGRSFLSDPPNLLEAETIDYDEINETGIASGSVIWQDTSAEMAIHCEEARYKNKDQFLLAYGGRPLLINVLDGDTMFVKSDTIRSFRVVEEDTIQKILAYHNVRTYKSNLQIVCDSLTYNDRDSLFSFFDDPIIWSDTSQFTADTIRLKLRDKQIDRIYLIRNAFIINTKDEVFYNQVKGKRVTAIFKGENMDRLIVDGNAESVYYITENDNSYSGVNQSISSEMMILFGNNEITNIKFYTKPKATLFPMGLADHDALILKGFRWITDIRPKGKNDLD